MEKIALVLGAGGSRGAFEVGAVRCLYENGVKPDIICGASAGSINAAKLTEGEGLDNQGLKGLESLWENLNSNSDMYVAMPWVNDLEDDMQDMVSRLTKDIIGLWSGILLQEIPGLGGSLLSVIDITEALSKIGNIIEEIQKSKSAYTLDPIKQKLNSTSVLDQLKVQNSGIELRMATVGLESGQVYYIDAHGKIYDENQVALNSENSVTLIEAIIASASIPVVFEPVKLNSQNYIDGGVRKFVPLKAAIDLGATTIYAIGNYKLQGEIADSFDTKNILDIAKRALTDIMPSEIQFDNLSILQGWNANVIKIFPNIELFNSLTIDPGLIQIGMDYGYMRAFEVLYGQDRDVTSRKQSADLADQIIALRLQIWLLEPSAGEFYQPRTKRDQTISLPEGNILLLVRENKKKLCALIAQRHDLGGKFPGGNYPENVKSWYQAWEKHEQDPSSIKPSQDVIPLTPWDEGEFTTAPYQVDAETPPDVPSQISISVSIDNPSIPNGPFMITVKAFDALQSISVPVQGDFILSDNTQLKLNVPFPHDIPTTGLSGLAKSIDYPTIPVSIQRPTPKIIVTVNPFPVPLNQLTSVTVFAKDSISGANINGTLTITNFGTLNSPPVIFPTNQPFQYTFRSRVVGSSNLVYPTGKVTAVGYPPAFVVFEDLDVNLPNQM